MEWFTLIIFVLYLLGELFKLMQRQREGATWDELFEDEQPQDQAAVVQQRERHPQAESPDEFFLRMEKGSSERQQQRQQVLESSPLPQIPLMAAPDIVEVPVRINPGRKKKSRYGRVRISKDDVESMRKAIVLNEVLGKPKGFRY